MKKLLSLFVLSILYSLPVYSIQWTGLTAVNGNSFYLDTDSIQQYQKYYFYNIKTHNAYTNDDIVITIQSVAKSGISARINYYSVEEYERLDGDYQNITSKITDKFEPVEYASIVHCAFSKVKSLIQSSKIQIQF